MGHGTRITLIWEWGKCIYLLLWLVETPEAHRFLVVCHITVMLSCGKRTQYHDIGIDDIILRYILILHLFVFIH